MMHPHGGASYMGVHRTSTRGEPNEIDLTATNPLWNGPPRFVVRFQDEAYRHTVDGKSKQSKQHHFPVHSHHWL